MNEEKLDAALEERFGGTAAQRRVVVRQAGDLAATGKPQADRGAALTADVVADNLADAPERSTLPERWNWWMGALEVAYGGYRQFQITAVPGE